MERLAEEDEEDGARHRLHRIQVILRTDYSVLASNYNLKRDCDGNFK